MRSSAFQGVIGPAGSGLGSALFVVKGVVQHGDARGRELGFPTANLVLADESVTGVADGVWVASVSTTGPDRLPMGAAAVTDALSAVSIGRRPTYYEAGIRLLEAFLIDFSGDLYDQVVTVALLKHVRPQQRFTSSAELVAALHQDVAHAREWASGRRIEKSSI